MLMNPERCLLCPPPPPHRGQRSRSLQTWSWQDISVVFRDTLNIYCHAQLKRVRRHAPVKHTTRLEKTNNTPHLKSLILFIQSQWSDDYSFCPFFTLMSLISPPPPPSLSLSGGIEASSQTTSQELLIPNDASIKYKCHTSYITSLIHCYPALH